MQPLTYQQTSGFRPTAVINRSQTKQAPGHEKIRDAVRARSAADNQDVVAALIVNEYREQGGGTIDFLMMSAVHARSCSASSITNSILKNTEITCVN